MSLTLRDVPGGTTLAVRVHPGARRNAITGEHDGALKISLTTPPTDGRANAALITFLADRFSLPRAQITLLTGVANRSKTFRLDGLTSTEIITALQNELSESS